MTLPFRENNLKLLKFRSKSKFCPNASLKMLVISIRLFYFVFKIWGKLTKF